MLLVVRHYVTTLGLGSRLGQWHGKVQIESATWESHSHSQECEWKSAKKWTHNSQVDSHFGSWNPKFSENDLQGQNSLNWKFPYTFEKFLRFICLKWACTIHLNTYNTSYGRKQGKESKCQFDFRPLKVKNLFELNACKWCATHCWKYFDKGYNFSLDLASIKGLQKNMGLQSCRSLNFGKFKALDLGV
jgi:p-aminobenzoyl-glutamate transporter AbgT